jgi:2,3-dimethylmalate lyase
MIEGGVTPFLKAAELQDLGYSAVGYPCGAIFSAVKAVQQWGSELLSAGTSDGVRANMLDFEQFCAFIRTEKIREREKAFV